MAYEEALKELTPEKSPMDWARAKMNLAYALGAIGANENGIGKLVSAISADIEAIKILTRERSPQDWGRIQLNIANSLKALSERQSGNEDLKLAIEGISRGFERIYERPRPNGLGCCKPNWRMLCQKAQFAKTMRSP